MVQQDLGLGPAMAGEVLGMFSTITLAHRVGAISGLVLNKQGQIGEGFWRLLEARGHKIAEAERADYLTKNRALLETHKAELTRLLQFIIGGLY